LSILDEDSQSDLNYDGVVNLIGALLRLTSQDIRYGSTEARQFLSSEWFETICDGLQVEPFKIRRMILLNNVKSRISYE
jgi:hypothetical protein